MKPEARAKFLAEEREYDLFFREQLLKDVPYFHELFAKYGDIKWLDIAKDVGTVLRRLSG